MKLIVRFALAVLIMSSVASCKKDHGSTSDTSAFVGNWELSQVIANMPTINLASGNGNVLTLTANTYAFRENGQLKKNGTYTLKDDVTAEQNVCLVFAAGTFTKRIIFDGDESAPKTFIDVTNNQLSLASGCFADDSGSKRIYKRLPTEY